MSAPFQEDARYIGKAGARTVGLGDIRCDKAFVEDETAAFKAYRGPKTTDASPLDRAQDEVDKSIACLNQLLEELAQRLRPVSAEYNGIAGTGPGQPEPPCCQVVGRMRSQAAVLQHLTIEVREILNRLEV